MLIKYNKTNIHALGTSDGKEIYNLRPGWNEFPARIWKQYETHPDIKQMLSARDIELMKYKPKKGKAIGLDDSELHLTDLKDDDAISVASSTFSRPMLQRWLDEETRHKVKRVVEKQLTPLLPEKKVD